jgi:hypothetical protein
VAVLPVTILRIKHTRQPEIRNFENTSAAEKEVCRLEILLFVTSLVRTHSHEPGA